MYYLHMCPIHIVCNGTILNVLPTFIATVGDVRAAKIHGHQHSHTKPKTNHGLCTHKPQSLCLVYIHIKPKSTVQISALDVCIPTVMKVSVINTSVNYNIYIYIYIYIPSPLIHVGKTRA